MGRLLKRSQARSHVAAQTIKTILQRRPEVLPHPAYSPFIFKSFQYKLAVQSFKTRNDVIKCIDEYFDSKNESFFNKSIQMLPERMENTSPSECIILTIYL